MRISCVRAGARWLFLSVVLSIAGALGLPAGKVWLAERWSFAPNPQQWQKAARLEPGNASYWLHLGIYHQEDFEHADLPQALAELQRAAQANPHWDTIWLHAADAYESLDNLPATSRAYQSAQSCHPISSEVAWRYGCFLLRRGDNPGAIAQIRRAILTDPSLTTSALSQFLAAGIGVSTILDDVLPARSDAYFSAASFFLSRHETAAALAAWSRVLQLHQRFEMQQAIPLVDELIRAGQVEDARKFFREALLATHSTIDEGEAGSLIFDGGFEHEMVNGGFGWRETPVSGAAFALDGEVAHSGKRSLRVTFDRSANLDFAQLSQYVAVEPNRRYSFSAYLRTQEVTTDRGLGFEVADARHPATLTLFTPELTGTNPWTALHLEFRTGADTHLLLLSLRRIPSRKFDNRLGGTVWVDDVSLVPLAPGAGGQP